MCGCVVSRGHVDRRRTTSASRHRDSSIASHHRVPQRVCQGRTMVQVAPREKRELCYSTHSGLRGALTQRILWWTILLGCSPQLADTIQKPPDRVFLIAHFSVWRSPRAMRVALSGLHRLAGSNGTKPLAPPCAPNPRRAIDNGTRDNHTAYPHTP